MDEYYCVWEAGDLILFVLYSLKPLNVTHS